MSRAEQGALHSAAEFVPTSRCLEKLRERRHEMRAEGRHDLQKVARRLAES